MDWTGRVWIMPHRWRAPDRELHLLDADGIWLRRLTVPAGSTLLDAGRDWAVVLQVNELDVQTRGCV